MAEPISLRIVVVSPRAGAALAVQLGRDGLLPPSHTTAEAVTFDLTLELVPGKAGGGGPTLRGAAAQGPPAARFVYVNAGRRAGDLASSWDRRAKVSLAGITAATLAAWQASPGAVLEARIAGTARDGGPACASVPLLDGGWQVRPSSP